MDLDSKTSGWDAIIGVEQMWEMLKQTVFEKCGSVMVRRKNPKSEWWDEEFRIAAERRESALKEWL